MPTTAYLKSFGAGILVLIAYFILVPTAWITVPILAGWFKAWLISRSTGGSLAGIDYVGGSVFHLRSPLFLTFAALAFAVGVYCEWRRLSVIQK
jgi:hypothetical protein